MVIDDLVTRPAPLRHFTRENHTQRATELAAIKTYKRCPTFQLIIDEQKQKLLDLHYIRAEGVARLAFGDRWEHDSWAIDSKLGDIKDMVRHRRYKMKRHKE